MINIEPGTNAAAFLCQWVSAQPRIESVKLFRVNQTPLLTADQLSQGDAAILASAMDLKQDTDMPFWDAAMLFASKSPIGSQKFFDRLLLHNSSDRGVVRLDRSKIHVEELQRILATLADGELLVLSSRVDLYTGNVAFIPMLDFHCKADSVGFSVAERVLRAMNIGGHLLSSGKSYHFYGDNLLGLDEQRVFLARALLFGSVIDRAWIAHQLIEGECGLRLSVRADYGTAPFVLGRVEASYLE